MLQSLIILANIKYVSYRFQPQMCSVRELPRFNFRVVMNFRTIFVIIVFLSLLVLITYCLFSKNYILSILNCVSLPFALKIIDNRVNGGSRISNAIARNITGLQTVIRDPQGSLTITDQDWELQRTKKDYQRLLCTSRVRRISKDY